MFVGIAPRFKVFEMFGIPVYVNPTFLFLLLLFVTDFGSFSFGLGAALMLAISIVAHEFAHALTGRAFGCATRDITLSILGGCASMVQMPRKAVQEFLVALAGPVMSFLLAGIGFAALLFLPIENDFLANLLAYLMWMNVILGCFNLLPGFPMDGGRIFRSVMRLFLSRARATFVAMWVGRAFAILLAVRGVWAIFQGQHGFLSILIAWMIWQDGYREYQLARMESSWGCDDYRAKVSPPPYGGEGDDCDVRKGDR